MRRISKDITKHYQIACSSMSYTPFAFYRLMFVMCLFCLFYGVLLTEKAKVLYEATVLKVEMTDECLTTIQSSREKLTLPQFH